MVKPKPELSKQPIRTKENITKSQWKLKQNKQFPEAREKADYQGAICFSFKSDWLRKWRVFFTNPRPEQKPKQFLITVDNQLKIALLLSSFQTIVEYIKGC